MFTPRRNFLAAMPRSLSAAAVLLAVAAVPVPRAMGQMAGSRGATERAAADVADMPLLQSPIASRQDQAESHSRSPEKKTTLTIRIGLKKTLFNARRTIQRR
jgi:hypothetical protein